MSLCVESMWLSFGCRLTVSTYARQCRSLAQLYSRMSTCLAWSLLESIAAASYRLALKSRNLMQIDEVRYLWRKSCMNRKFWNRANTGQLFDSVVAGRSPDQNLETSRPSPWGFLSTEVSLGPWESKIGGRLSNDDHPLHNKWLSTGNHCKILLNNLYDP